MTQRDHYYNKAKQEGYRSRAAYKLKQLDEAAGLFGPGNTVVDLGAVLQPSGSGGDLLRRCSAAHCICGASGPPGGSTTRSTSACHVMHLPAAPNGWTVF